MLFLQSGENGRELSVATARVATGVSLAAYPIGALMLALGPNSLAVSMSGYFLIFSSLTSFAMLSGSSIQRIAAEQAAVLDEYELHLRSKAMNYAYTLLSILVLVAVIYAAIATDKNWWIPRTYEEFNGLFWGVFLYASVLPTTVLAWTATSPAGAT